MLAFDSYRELTNGKRYKTNTDHETCENGSTEDNRVCNSAEKTEEEASEVRVLTQEAVNEQMKRFFAPPPHKAARGIDSAGSRAGDNAPSEPLPKGRS